MPPRAVDRSAVIEAARRCFIDLGVRDATVDEVARRAGVSRATVYRSVGGRSELVREVMLDEGIALFTAVGLAISEAYSAHDVVSRGVGAALVTIRDRPVLRRFTGPDLVDVLAVLTVDAAPLVAGAVNLLEPVLADAQARGALAEDVDVRHAAEELIRYVIGLLHTPSAGANLTDPGVGADRAARLFAPALSTPALVPAT